MSHMALFLLQVLVRISSLEQQTLTTPSLPDDVLLQDTICSAKLSILIKTDVFYKEKSYDRQYS